MLGERASILNLYVQCLSCIFCLRSSVTSPVSSGDDVCLRLSSLRPKNLRNIQRKDRETGFLFKREITA